MRPVAVIGHATRDVVDGGGEPRIGGAPWYGGRALRSIAIRAHVGFKSGEEDRRRFARALAANGLPAIAVTGGETTAFAIEHDGELRRLTVLALGEPWTPREAVRAAGDTRWVHVAPVLRDDFPLATLAALARGRRVVLDAQGLARIRQVGPVALDAAFDPELLRHVTALKLAEEEALALLGTTDEQALAELGVPEVLLTFGARGCVVHTRDGVTRVPAHATDVADTTGAGDAFASAYTATRSQGHAPASAARRATAVVASMLR